VNETLFFQSNSDTANSSIHSSREVICEDENRIEEEDVTEQELRNRKQSLHDQVLSFLSLFSLSDPIFLTLFIDLFVVLGPVPSNFLSLRMV
jgi:hypothetical protein